MSNRTPFQLVMEEVLEHGQKAEALGFKVLSAMIDMETTFHVEWLKDYHIHKNTRGYQADRIREVLVELLGESYQAIIDDSKIDVAKNRTKPEMLLKKQLAQKKRINLDNRVRSCIEALVFFRINPLGTDGLKVNNLNKTASFITKAGQPYKALTFTDVQEMSNACAAEQGWVPKPKESEKSEGSTVANNGAAKVEPSLARTEENGNKLFESSLLGMKDLINRTDLTTMSNDGIAQMIQLAKTCLLKAFGNTKGRIELNDLALDFNGILIHKDGTRVKLETEDKAA